MSKRMITLQKGKRKKRTSIVKTKSQITKSQITKQSMLMMMIGGRNRKNKWVRPLWTRNSKSQTNEVISSFAPVSKEETQSFIKIKFEAFLSQLKRLSLLKEFFKLVKTFLNFISFTVKLVKLPLLRQICAFIPIGLNWGK